MFYHSRDDKIYKTVMTRLLILETLRQRNVLLFWPKNGFHILDQSQIKCAVFHHYIFCLDNCSSCDIEISHKSATVSMFGGLENMKQTDFSSN